MVTKLIRVCCVCKKSEHKGKWDHHEHHKEPIKKNEKTTHGYCDPCLNIELEKIKSKYE